MTLAFLTLNSAIPLFENDFWAFNKSSKIFFLFKLVLSLAFKVYFHLPRRKKNMVIQKT
ncbi:MAG: hypothetical protein CM1200mP13_05780 [Candidatus Pelagibacterales bacterium]|nr:MAG: hypothetical protein CM1200mP13_05780 [Pelagibacterales bacterium]